MMAKLLCECCECGGAAPGAICQPRCQGAACVHHALAFQWDDDLMTSDAAAVLATVKAHTRPVGATTISLDLGWRRKGDEVPRWKNSHRERMRLSDTHRVVVATKELLAAGLLATRISAKTTRYKAI
jgi:hypothetical protein